MKTTAQSCSKRRMHNSRKMHKKKSGDNTRNKQHGDENRTHGENMRKKQNSDGEKMHSDNMRKNYGGSMKMRLDNTRKKNAMKMRTEAAT